MVLGTLLLSGTGSPLTEAVAASLMAGFIVAVSLNVSRGRRIPCLCFGEGTRELIGPATVLRLTVLELAALTALALHDAPRVSLSTLDRGTALDMAYIVVGSVLVLRTIGPAEELFRRVAAVRRARRPRDDVESARRGIGRDQPVGGLT